MKQIPFLFLVLMAVSIIGCRDFSVDSDEVEVSQPGHREFSVKPTEPFVMALGDIVSVEGTNLEFEFALLMSDSRCPANVQCIHPGEAKVLFEISNGTDGGFQLVAHIPGLVRTPYETNNIIQVQDLRFQLLSLTPYPVDGGEVFTDADYRATISITPAF